MTEANPSGATTIHEAAKKIGELLEPTGQPEPEEEETPLEVQDDETPEEPSSEVKVESESEEPEATPEPTEEPATWTVDEFANATGMTREDALSNLKGVVTINGEESQVSLSELQSGYQREADYRQKTMTLGDERKAFEAERDTTRQDMQAKLQQVDAVLNAQEAQLTEQYNSINWAELRVDDPQQYTLLESDFQKAFAQTQTQKANAKAETDRLIGEQRDKAQQTSQQWVANEHAAFLQLVPEWSDPKIAQAESAKLEKHLAQSVGVKPHEMMLFVDHRLRAEMLKAMKWDELQKGKPALEKKVRTAPKLLKPGSTTTKVDIKGEQQKKQRARLKKTGKVDDAARLIRSVL